MKKVEEVLKQLVSFNTVGDEENNKMINWIEKFCLDMGFKTKLMKNENDNNLCLVASSGNCKKNGLIFSGHTDTVPAGDGWKTNPFELTQINDVFYGLGSADMKGGIASMLVAISEIDLSNLNKGLELIFTYDEEKTFEGIKNVVENHLVSADCILIGEPTSLKPVIATKGALVFKINFIGKNAHGGNPEVGINAIEMASNFVMELKKYSENLKNDNDYIFDSSSATINIAKINGGDAINKVPSSCLLEFEFRIINNKQNNKIHKDIISLIKQNNFKADIEMSFSLPIVKCQDKNFITVIEGITKNKVIGVNYATEASFFPNQNNFVILGPGSIKSAHKANESIAKSSLDKAVNLYKELINKFCS